MVRQWMAESYKERPDFKVNHLISEGDLLTALGEITSKDAEGKEVNYALTVADQAYMRRVFIRRKREEKGSARVSPKIRLK